MSKQVSPTLWSLLGPRVHSSGIRCVVILCLGLISHTLRATEPSESWRHPLTKQGYLSSPLVEVTPFVFQDRLYLLESWQEFLGHADANPEDYFHEDVARIRDVQVDEIVSVALTNCGFAHALVWEDRVYVFAGDYGEGKPWRRITEIVMTSSDDLKNWTKPVTVIDSKEEELLFNTAVCRGKDDFILLYETNDKRWPAFTFKYCHSADLKKWKQIPGAFYGREKYVGGPALYYAGNWYYTLYLESLGNHKFETRITRSRDLKQWEDAPAGKPFVSFDESRTNLPLRPPEMRETNASDAELCYFQGRTIVYFTGSDQKVGGDLQWATFDGTPRALFERFFK